jgi:predicted Zn-dependent peptidase
MKLGGSKDCKSETRRAQRDAEDVEAAASAWCFGCAYAMIPKEKSLVQKVTPAILRKKFANGLVLVAEPMPHARSISVGMWLRAGSRREPAALNGIAHFIEHMVFKGTERRSAEQIAREVDSVGGMLDAFTSKEATCFNARVLDQHLPLAFDVLSDMVLRPLFAAEDIVKEKQVILEEIRMEDDNPESVAHELLVQNFWRGHPLGWPIIGTRATVKHFTRASAMKCFEPWYAPNNLVITAAGKLEPEKLCDLVEATFGDRRAAGATKASRPPKAHGKLAVRNKPALEQAHITIAVPSYPLAHPRRYATSVLNNILGGGMSSRLFQNIRERQGLAYAVFSDMTPYSDAGMLSVYAGTSRRTVEKVLRLVVEEFRRMKEEPVAEEELRRAKDHLKGSLVLSLESSGSRMSSLARQEMYLDRFYTIEELQAAVEAVTREEVQEIAREFFRPEQIAVTVVGPMGGFRLRRDLLAC